MLEQVNLRRPREARDDFESEFCQFCKCEDVSKLNPGEFRKVMQRKTRPVAKLLRLVLSYSSVFFFLRDWS